MQKEKISIVVPIYNVEKYLVKCIESLSSQNYQNLEIILVNDGSTDGCTEICREYEKRDKRIVVIDQCNRGANAARNAGIKKATGKWIGFVDGDDWVDEHLCVEVSSFLDDDIDILFYNTREHEGANIKEFHRGTDVFAIDEDDFVEMQYATLNRLGNYKFNYSVIDSVNVIDKLYRTEFLREHNLLFDETLPKLQDLLFNLYVYDVAKCGLYIGKTLYNYRVHEESVSKRFQKDLISKYDIINVAICNFMHGKEDDKLRKAYNERISTNLRTCIIRCICNPKNPNSYFERKRIFKNLIEREPYKNAIKQCDLQQFTIQERMISWMIKKRMFFCCELLCGLYYKWKK
jgi:glycosyltransferase EpsH